MNDARTTRSGRSIVKAQVLGKSKTPTSLASSSTSVGSKGKGRAASTTVVPASRIARPVLNNTANKSPMRPSIDNDVIDLSSDAMSDDEEIEIVGVNVAPASSKAASTLMATRENMRLQSELRILHAKLASKDKQLNELQRNVNSSPTNVALEAQLESIKSALECAICCDTLGRPFAVNPCGHEFCAKCLKDWFENSRQNNGGKLECPTCRTAVEGRPVRTFVLRSIVDVVQQDHLKGAKAGMEDDKEFWRELFPPRPLNTAAAQGIGYPAPAPMGPAGNAVPPNVAGWVMPRYVSTLQLPVEWAHQPNELLRRGAQPRMIHQLRLTYTRDTGICGYAGGAHVHFGWVIPPDLRSDNPHIEWDTYIQTAILQFPNRWARQATCVCRLQPAA